MVPRTCQGPLVNLKQGVEEGRKGLRLPGPLLQRLAITPTADLDRCADPH